MEQLKGLPLGRQLILGAGVLLFVDSLLHWQQYDSGPFSAHRFDFMLLKDAQQLGLQHAAHRANLVEKD